MATIGTRAAKTHFSQLLDRAGGGERITITRRGIPVAVLGPARQSGKEGIAEAINELKALRRDKSLGDLTIQEMIEDGKRF